jgi:hypothetical protein
MANEKIITFDNLQYYHNEISQTIDNKQDAISDLSDIRAGASKGASALQSVKTINNQSLIGSGNITIAEPTIGAADTGESVDGVSNEYTMANRKIKDAIDMTTNEAIYFRGHAKATYMSNGSTVEDAVKNIFEKIYPAGSIYISAANVNPNILFGIGEWEQIKDVFLLAAGDIYSAGSTGGEAEHTLTIDEMPKHTHRFKTDINSPDYDVTWPEWTEYTTGWTQEDNETVSPASQVTYTGGNQPHNNMPPYLTVYIWKRIR